MDNVMKAPRSTWVAEAHDKDGKFLWRDEYKNIVFDAAIADLLDVYFRDGVKKPVWYVGLINSPATLLAGDTAASHPGWSENGNYTNTTRRVVNFSPVINKQINSVGNKAVFTLTGAGGNIFGTFLASNEVKNSTAGILYAAAPFATGSKNLTATDVLTISVVISGA
jgi:hypothetical protein